MTTLSQFTVNADMPTKLVTLHRSSCKEGQVQDKEQRYGGWEEFTSRSEALNRMTSWTRERYLRPHYCSHCNPMD